MPSVRPKGCGGGSKVPPVTPMSERQQMALLMQMTSSSGSDAGSRSPSGSSGASRSRDRNERGETPLHLAAIKGDVEQVCKLLAHRADPNVADFAGWTPLHEACNHGWYEVAFRLVQAGANVNAKGLDNDTPLHDAAANGHFKLVKLLVEKGADIYAKNSKGKTPLDTAAPDVAPFLLNPNLPIPESSASTRVQPRLRDEKKISEPGKPKVSTDSTMDASKTGSPDDVYEFKSVKESDNSPDEKSGDNSEVDNDSKHPASTLWEESAKRNFSEMSETQDENNDDESRRKKRKEDGSKETKGIGAQRASGQAKGQGSKQGADTLGKSGLSGNKSSTNSGDKVSPCASPKPTSVSDGEEEGKADMKVPPLKIVIPQMPSSEQESGQTRNGKGSSQRAHQALPYVVASSNNESNDKELPSGIASPTENTTQSEEKQDSSVVAGDEQRSSSSHQRVLRSSHRTGTSQGTVDRSSNNSSPHLQRSHSPSPSASPAAPFTQIDAHTTSVQSTSAGCTTKTSDTQAASASDTESTTSASTSTAAATPAPVQLHPRKRKLKPNKEIPTSSNQEQPETTTVTEVHPHEQPITNSYQQYLNIRKQVQKRRSRMFPIIPKNPPEGFQDYLVSRRTYVLAGKTPTTPNISYPPSLLPQMQDLFTEQEKERYKLKMQHVIEKEKLVLAVEQEIVRVHGRAARKVANHPRPYSVCMVLMDEEVYNPITSCVQVVKVKDKTPPARPTPNGRAVLSWLSDVDSRWEKIKDNMLTRHKYEAEALHAVQKMEWEWKLKELNLCDAKTTPTIDSLLVPKIELDDVYNLESA